MKRSGTTKSKTKSRSSTSKLGKRLPQGKLKNAKSTTRASKAARKSTGLSVGLVDSKANDVEMDQMLKKLYGE